MVPVLWLSVPRAGALCAKCGRRFIWTWALSVTHGHVSPCHSPGEATRAHSGAVGLARASSCCQRPQPWLVCGVPARDDAPPNPPHPLALALNGFQRQREKGVGHKIKVVKQHVA